MGCDASGQETTYYLSEDGKHYIINGESGFKNEYQVSSFTIYSLENFVDKKGLYKFKKNNIMTFINNFYTHFRLLKEKMDMNPEDDSIHMNYKRVDNYENMDVYDSIISTLKHPRNNYSNDQIIDIIHENFGITIEIARQIYQQWEETTDIKEKQGKKTYRTTTKEPGSSIIMDKFLEKNIRLQFRTRSVPDVRIRNLKYHR